MAKPLIPRVDYQRIFRTLYSVLRHADCNMLGACEWLNIIGAFILRKHYGLNAQPVAGMTAYRVSNAEKGVMFFADTTGDHPVASDNGYHCWIQADEWLIDFAAPLFPQIGKQYGLISEARMMQQRLSTMKSCVEDLIDLGDFLAIPNQEVTGASTQRFFNRRFNHDLIAICLEWYVRPPKQMEPVLSIMNDRGQPSKIDLIHFEIDGVW